MSGVASKIAHQRAKSEGLGSINNPRKFAGQDFEKLKAECLAAGTLFQDPVFPATAASLGLARFGPDTDKGKDIVWKRPSEINNNPVFIDKGADREDVRQGSVNNCWFVSATACLTLNPDALSQVVPQDQTFEKEKGYAGIFNFTLSQFGEYFNVIIDDLLPTKNNSLRFAKSKTSNEFWSSLLEKAYAKVNGSYEALEYGYQVEALQDLTGGVGVTYNTSTAPDDLFQIIQRELRDNNLAGCSSVGAEEAKAKNIVTNHIYSIVRVEEVQSNGEVVPLIRVRNPWGYKEWNGAWSDNAPEWDSVDPKVKAELNVQKDDGEVWMRFSDFLKQFRLVEICDLQLSSARCGDKWCLTEFNGSWKTGSSSGGPAGLDTFWINPQYRIALQAPDGDASKKCIVIVALSQKEQRKKKSGKITTSTGFYIYKIDPSDQVPLGKEFFKKNQSVGSYDDFRPYRDIAKQFELPPGDYVIVPVTKTVPEDIDFYMRVFTEKPTGAQDTGSNVQANIYEPIITPETDSEFEIVKDELQKGEFNENEVKDLLNKMLSKYPEIKSEGFNAKAVGQLIKLMDEDNTGTLSTYEFKRTWLKVKNYMKIFRSADVDGSGSISSPEFRNALKEAGFTLGDGNFDAIVDRCMDRTQLQFVEFLTSIANLETLFKMFKTLDRNQSESIKLSVYEWLCLGLSYERL